MIISRRVIIIVLCIIAFVSLGEFIPYAFNTYMPITYFVNYSNFSGEDISFNDTQQTILLTKFSRNDYPSSSTKELLCIYDNVTLEKISYANNFIINKADTVNVYFKYNLPDNLREGSKCWWEEYYTIDVEGVTRRFKVVSDVFTVKT